VTSTPLSIVKTLVISNVYRCEQMVQEVRIRCEDSGRI
jgi:hypothetical protein